MQQVQFETSMKNIPLGGKKEYVMQLDIDLRMSNISCDHVLRILIDVTS